MAWVRSAGLRGVRATVEELGGDADEFARRCGAPAGALDDDELLIQDTVIAAILETVAREMSCLDFGMRVALRQDLSMLGPLAVALQNSPTAADALDCTSKYLFVHARQLGLTVVPDPRNTRGVLGIRYGYPPGVQAPPQSMEMGLLFLHRALTGLVDSSYGLRSVELPHAPLSPRSRYTELFRAEVHFSQPAALLRVSSDLPRRPLAGADQTIRQLALAHLESQTPNAGRAFTAKVKMVLQRSLGTGSTTVEAVARILAVSARSLQRHLAAEGTIFGAVLDEVRRDRAETLLTQTTIPLAQVASMLGLSDPATLSRYARRWWGTTARARRAAGLPSSR